MNKLFEGKRSRIIREIDELLESPEISYETNLVLSTAKMRLLEKNNVGVVESFIKDKFMGILLIKGKKLSESERKYLHILQRRTGPGRGLGPSRIFSQESSESLETYLTNWKW